MPTAANDFYHQKTDAELLFFVEHPEYYHPTLIEEARHELRRRGVPVVAPASETPDGASPRSPGAGLRTRGWPLLAAAVLVLGTGVVYFSKRENDPAATAPVVAKTSKAPPRLTEVATSVIPNYNDLVRQSVQRQVQRIPAAERAAAAKADQPMRQYRELAKRFWAAETQTEYVIEQARQGKLHAALPGHVETVEATWQEWNKAQVYRYQFGPVMASHLDLMQRAAQQQQEGLADLLLVANNPQPFENEKTSQRAAEVSDLLSGLLAKSPVTGQPYHAIVRHITL